MGPPYSKCGKKPLEYFDTYTYFACKTEAAIRNLNDSCGCRVSYMPSNHQGKMDLVFKIMYKEERKTKNH